MTAGVFLPKQNSALGRSLVASLTWRWTKPLIIHQIVPSGERSFGFLYLRDVGELEGSHAVCADGEVLWRETDAK